MHKSDREELGNGSPCLLQLACCYIVLKFVLSAVENVHLNHITTQHKDDSFASQAPHEIMWELMITFHASWKPPMQGCHVSRLADNMEWQSGAACETHLVSGFSPPSPTKACQQTKSPYKRRRKRKRRCMKTSTNL
jgi:hypothetical protein